MKHMKLVRVSLIMLFFLCSLVATAQGAYLEKGDNGFGTEVRAMCTTEAFRGIGFTAGYSIAGILDVGLDLGYTLGEFPGSDSTELSLGFSYNVNVLKQSAGVPLSVQILGSYGLANVSDDALPSDLVRRATGYTIGVSLGRTFRLTSFWLLRVTGLLDYESKNYLDKQIFINSEGDPVVTVVNMDHVRNLLFGGGLGFLFVFPKGQILAVQAEFRADEDLDLQIHPILALAFPQK
jgi:hypothetical protein